MLKIAFGDFSCFHHSFLIIQTLYELDIGIGQMELNVYQAFVLLLSQKILCSFWD